MVHVLVRRHYCGFLRPKAAKSVKIYDENAKNASVWPDDRKNVQNVSEKIDSRVISGLHHEFIRIWTPGRFDTVQKSGSVGDRRHPGIDKASAGVGKRSRTDDIC